jgi:hypothetical protein
MKKVLIVAVIYSFLFLPSGAQVKEMNWKLDYQIYLKMANDSNYTYDIRDLFHVTKMQKKGLSTDYIFYPVNPGKEYTLDLENNTADSNQYKTLWNALHAKIGGGWIHFINCIAYALQIQKLDLQVSVMQRPETSWKPKPVTESWKHTRKWEYYVPVNQKYAIKEYKKRKSNNDLRDLSYLPQSYIDLFLNTSNKDYQKLKEEKKLNELAKIDLVKIILASNYLGKAQINYIGNAVLAAVKKYSSDKLPSILIFDEFDAAAAMTLDLNGYKIESLVFRASAGLADEEMHVRKIKMLEIIDDVNAYNQEIFEKRLENYYQN